MIHVLAIMIGDKWDFMVISWHFHGISLGFMEISPIYPSCNPVMYGFLQGDASKRGVSWFINP